MVMIERQKPVEQDMVERRSNFNPVEENFTKKILQLNKQN